MDYHTNCSTSDLSLDDLKNTVCNTETEEHEILKFPRISKQGRADQMWTAQELWNEIVAAVREHPDLVEQERIIAQFSDDSGYSKKAVASYLKHAEQKYRSQQAKLGQDAPPGPGASEVELLIGLSKKECTLWHDADGNAFVTVQNDDHKENWPIQSNQFKSMLRSKLYNAWGKAIRTEYMEQATALLEQEAKRGALFPTAIRLAGHNNKVYLDLCNEQWQVVEVDSDGYRIIENPPIKFVRKKAMRALPVPTDSCSLDQFLSLLNLTDEDSRILVTGWIISAFHPTGPYFVLVLTGGQGAAKSTTARALRGLIDPNAVPLRSLPGNEEDLAIMATNAFVVPFDNVSRLSCWQSDALCRLSTGGGLSKRKLYSDDDEVILDNRRPVILNGIPDFVNKPDLLSRCLLVTLEEISEEDRLTEEEFIDRYNALVPAILGALLKILSDTLERIPETKLTSKPRMADAARWITAAETALGWKPGTFAYSGERGPRFRAKWPRCHEALNGVVGAKRRWHV